MVRNSCAVSCLFGFGILVTNVLILVKFGMILVRIFGRLVSIWMLLLIGRNCFSCLMVLLIDNWYVCKFLYVSVGVVCLSYCIVVSMLF